MNSEEESYAAVKETLELLKEGDQVINEWNHYDDSILVIGLTGAGKSTATMFIAGDNTKLESYETVDGCCLIRDVVEDGDNGKGHISTSENTIVSKTIFPHLILQPPVGSKTSPTAFYDCPGFSDTRSTAIEIANSYFTRKIAENSKQVKVLLVVDHNSVRMGKDRDDFILFLQHISKFFPNVDKFKDSLTLLSNKAEQPKKDDAKLMKGIVTFLKNTKANVEQIFNGAELDNSRKILDALLQQNDSGDYTRITFCRVPTDEGLLSDIAEVQENKEHILNVIHNNTKYVEKEEGDFGITLSPTAQNDILKITVALNDKIISLFGHISQRLSTHFNTQTATTFELQNLVHLSLYFNLINDLPAFEDDLIKNNATSVTNQILSSFKEPLLVDIPASFFEQIEEHARYIDIFLGITKDLTSLQEQFSFLKPSDWIAPLKQFVKSQTIAVSKVVNDSDDRILLMLQKNNVIMTDYFTSKIKGLTQQINFPTELRRLTKIMRALQDLGKTSRPENETPQAITSFIKTYLELINQFASKMQDYDSIQQLLSTASKLDSLEDQLEMKNDKDTTAKCTRWQLKLQEASCVDIATVEKAVQEIEKRITFKVGLVCDEVRSYFAQEFARRDSQAACFQSNKLEQLEKLNGVYKEIRKSQPQGSLSAFITNTCEKISNVIDSTELHSLKSLEEEAEGLELLLEVISERIEIQRSAWFDPLEKVINDLQNTIQKEEYEPVFDEGSKFAKIQGTFISLNKIVENESILSRIKSKGSTHLIIFSRHTIYINSTRADINFGDLSVLIISPVWVVPEDGRTIIMQGVHNSHQFGDAAGRSSDGKGLPGKPGYCGGNAGNFLGVGQHVVGGKLHVKSNGGNGGNGQNGGSGANGKNGDQVDQSRISFTVNGTSKRNTIHTVPNFRFNTCPYKLKEINYCAYDTSIGNIITGWYTMWIAQHYTCIEYQATSSRATMGEIGGKGGYGGRGGSKGDISLHFPDGYNGFFTCHSADGGTGKNGSDGVGGSYGQPGSDAKIWVDENLGISFKERTAHSHVYDKPTGLNNVGQEYPTVNTKMPVKTQEILKLYRAFARSACSNPLHKKSLWNFLVWQYESPQRSVTITTVEDYMDEFYSLEEQYTLENSLLDFEPFYKMQKENIQKILKSTHSFTKQDEQVMLYIYTAALTRHNSFNKNYEQGLIIDMKGYLQQAQENIKSFQENARSIQVLSMIKTTMNRYEELNNSKLKEANNFINKIITPDITRLEHALENKVKDLLAEIKDLKSRTKLEAEMLERKRQELKKQMALNAVFGALKVGATAISIMGPVGTGVGAVIGAGVGAAEFITRTTSSSSSNPDPQVVLPPAVLSLSKKLDSKMTELSRNRVENFVSKLNAIHKILEVEDDISTSGIITKVNDAKKEVTTLLRAVENKKQLAELNSLMRLKINEVQAALENQINVIGASEYNSLDMKRNTRLSRLKSAKNVFAVAAELYSKLGSDEQTREEISLSISSSDKKLQTLNRFEEKVQEEMSTLLSGINEDLENARNELSSRSAVSLDVAKWEIKRMLEDAKVLLREQFTGGFEVDVEMTRVFDKLNESFSTLIQIYDRMQQIQEQTRVANFIAEINLIPFSDKNPKILKLDSSIQANVILGEYQLILNSLKMWAFPFAKVYFGDLQPLSHWNKSTYPELKDLISVVGRNVDKILAKVTTQKATVGTAMDEYIHRSRFDDAKSTPKPFYTWSYKENMSLIENLIEGHEVVFNADIINSKIKKNQVLGKKLNAVKFNKIELALDLNLPPDSDQAGRNDDLDAVLENYNVVLTHMGNSYYKYGSKFYTISSKPIVFSFNFHSIQGGLPTNVNASYEKVLNGDVMLSPYTMWKIKLVPVDSDGDCRKLVELINKNLSAGYEPDLKLLGSGSYVSNGLEDDLMLDSYYTPHSF